MTTATTRQPLGPLFIAAAINALGLGFPDRPFRTRPADLDDLLAATRAGSVLAFIGIAQGGDRELLALPAPVYPIGQVFHHSFQPYDDVKFTIDSVEPVLAEEPRFFGGTQLNAHVNVRASRGYLRLKGTVLEGRRVSRLFGHSSTTIIAGEYHLEVTPDELRDLRRVDVACG